MFTMKNSNRKQMKAKFRKTGEIVDIISYSGNADRNDVLDCVSYIDSKGVEHSREKLNLYWDFESIQETSIAPNIDWNQIEIQAAIGAMQAMIQRGGIIPNMQYQYTLDADHHKVMAIEAALYARALVKELKKADMSYYILDYEPVLTIGMAQVYRETIKGGKIIEKQNAEVIPAWSLHRLIELYSDVEDTSSLCIKDVSYKLLIFCIEKAIHCGFFNKEYLKQ